MKNRIVFLKTIMALFIILAMVFFYKAYDKKSNYKNPNGDNYYSYTSKNSYVGGDAYNYIINANYFTGFIVLGSTFTIISVMLFISILYFQNELDKNESNIIRNSISEYEDLPKI